LGSAGLPPGTSRTTIALAITDVLMPHAAADLADLDDEREMWRLIRARRFPMPLRMLSPGGRFKIPAFDRSCVR
jgi:hypothetical protein